MGEIILCAAAAFVGAGFASGREIMQFFSVYGSFSWTLVIFASVVTVLMFRRATALDEDQSVLYKGLLILFYAAVSGGMTAAAGELWALTVPIPYARCVGSVVTLMICLRLAGGRLKSLARLGKALIPLLLAVLILCLRIPGSEAEKRALSWREGMKALISAAGYCGLNGMTAAGVLRGPHSEKDRRRISLCGGLLTGLLLGLGNAALLPHADTLRDAPLPVVTLLRAYGKTGYYLSAAALYLASSTTLIAVLRGLLALSKSYLPRYEKTAAALAVLTVSLLGFDGIVGKAYPALGGAYLFLLMGPSETASVGGKRKNARSAGKTVRS